MNRIKIAVTISVAKAFYILITFQHSAQRKCVYYKEYISMFI